MMPGLQQSWPEGIFYGFNAIYDGERLDYKGPPFGWWTIPDQFVVARLDAAEIEPRRARAAVRVLPDDRHAHAVHADGALSARLAADADAASLRAGRRRALVVAAAGLDEPRAELRARAGATYTWIGGLLRKRADRDLVMILIGDHQPPALVSGEGASWEVPVHVIANRANHPAVLDALRARGFRDGLVPHHPKISKMHELMPILLDAFSGADRQ